jgi:hypothetical protein
MLTPCIASQARKSNTMNLHPVLRQCARAHLLLPRTVIFTFLAVQITMASPANKIYLPLVARQETKGIWLAPEEVSRLPISGVAWVQLLEAAKQTAGVPDLSDQDSATNVLVLAKALVYARTGEGRYRDEVLAALQVITFDNTEADGRTLALGRELAAYVIAADLIQLPTTDPTLHEQFSRKLRELLSKPLVSSGTTSIGSLQQTHEDRPNNWGTHAGASRAAVAVYLGDWAELQRTAQVFQGYLGDRTAYHDFAYHDDLSWQADPSQPVGINPKGSTKEGHAIDGALPEEMRRGGSFTWPPIETGYAWEGLQGALVQAEILHRAGYPAYGWQDQALLRAVQFLYNIGWTPTSDDEWLIWLVNRAYVTHFPANPEARPGKNLGWTNWTHARP